MIDNLIDFISKDVQKYTAGNRLLFIDIEKAGLIAEADCLTVNEKHTQLEMPRSVHRKVL